MIGSVPVDWMPYPEANTSPVPRIVLTWADRYNSITLEVDEA